jgi:diguanylate cyclase (GGDEF)-like protein/PAS domain S-box-containing protein
LSAAQHLKTLKNAMPVVLVFLVFDAGGTVLASDKPELIGKNFAQSEYFQAALQRPNSSTLYVRPPFMSSRGSYAMNFARIVPDGLGKFDGLVVAGLDAEEFKVLLNSVLYRADTRASLIHSEGVPFLTAPNSIYVGGVDLVRPGSFFTQHINSGRETNVFSGTITFDGDERLIALQTIKPVSLAMDNSMVIAIDRPLKSILINWHRQALNFAAMFSTLLVVSGISLLFYQRRRINSSRSQSRHTKEREASVEALRHSEDRFRRLIKLSSDWYWEQDDQFRFVQLPGELDPKTRLANNAHVGRTRWEMGALNLTEADWEAHREMLRQRQEFRGFEMQRRSDDGSLIWRSISGMPIYDSQGIFRGYQGIARDITERKASEEQIKHLAFYDGLTQLPNRRLLMDRLDQSFAASKRSGCYGALIFLDLDNFKPINDLHGHEVGDLLLIEAATRLKNSLREADTAARFGGDEFVVVVNDLGLDKDESKVRATAIAENLRLKLVAPYVIAASLGGIPAPSIEHQCAASIGVALFKDHEVQADELIKRADIAMYQAKEAGRNAVLFYEPVTDLKISDVTAVQE